MTGRGRKSQVRYFIHLNYNGGQYNGWQVQPGHRTVQGELERSVSVLLRTETGVTGCGRTDTGVHARSYYAHFDADRPLPRNFTLRLNKMLPPDIGITGVYACPSGGHARFDAVQREYRYFIHFRKDAFLQDRSFWLYGYDLDMEAMNRVAAELTGKHDFSAFEKRGSDNATSVCRVDEVVWQAVNENQWVFVVKADRFLRNMVRRMAAALLSVGMGKLNAADISRAMNAASTLEVPVAVPAYGLFLWGVTYPETLTIDWKPAT